MKSRILALCLGLIGPGLLLITTGVTESQEQPPPPPDQPAATGDTEAMARGPVHEAYAEPVNYQPQPGPVVSKQPPDPIEEQPPDQKPDGSNVQWIPGYWAWDEQSKDYLWVSGFWRDVPPGQRWVPGAWQEVEGGWQWSPGFWTSDQNDQVNYVPSPPPSVDAGPSVPPQNETDVYVPGCWMWRDTRFLWRPGFFVAYRPDWVWVPARYIWTPGGCVFVDGYWDHPLERRGLLFCPVRILRREFAGWVYTPSFVVQPDFLLTALFVGPARHSYWFGDFFEDRFTRAGFVPWLDYRPTRHSFDPLFNHYRVEFREDPAWDRNLHDLYRGRFSGDIPRPPHTIIEQQKLVQNITVNKQTNITINNVTINRTQLVSALAPVKEVHNVQVTNLAVLAPKAKPPEQHVVKLTPVPKEQLAQVKEHIQQVQHVAQTRREVESKLVAGGTVHTKPAEHPQGAQLNLPKPAAPTRPAAGRPAPPPPPAAPKHEERPIPQHEPPKPPQPPKQAAKPPTQPPPPPPKKEEKPPPKKEEKPQQQPPPKHEPPPPPPPKKEPPPPPPKHEPPPPPPKHEPPPPPPKHEPPPPPPKKEPPPPPPPKKEPPPPPKKDDKPPPKKDGSPARAAHAG